MQLARQLADFLIQAVIAHLVQFADQMDGILEFAAFQAGDQFVRALFQGRLEVTHGFLDQFHDALLARVRR
ncbi:hypothetical protein D3C80_2160650 [compost metagenome]